MGRNRDELGINYIHSYLLEKPENSRPGPGLDPSRMRDSSEPVIEGLGPDTELLEEVQGLDGFDVVEKSPQNPHTGTGTGQLSAPEFLPN